MEKEIKINLFWLKAITSEMALNYNTGLVNRLGSPFAQFKKVFPMCPRKKKEALCWAHQMMIDNGIKPLGYMTKTVESITNSSAE